MVRDWRVGEKIVSRKKTQREFEEELYIINPDIEVIGEYINCNTKLPYRCKVCGNVHNAPPVVLLKGQGCPKCSLKERALKRIKDHDYFLNSIADKANPNIEIIGRYVRNDIKIKCRCKICGKEYEALPDNIRKGKGCNACEHLKGSKKRQKSPDDFEREVQSLNLDYIVLEKYKGCKEKLLCECLVCGYKWKRTADGILQNKSGCPQCSNKRQSQILSDTTEDFINKMKLINPKIVVVGEYVNNATPIQCRCLDCGQTFMAIPRNLTTRKTCPLCTVSKGEDKIRDFLIQNNITFEREKTFANLIGVGGGKLRFDFYLPSNKTLIEYNGIQHEKPIDFGGKGIDFAETKYKTQYKNDSIKKDFANEQGLKLIEIWYYDFDKITSILSQELVRK